MAGESFSTSQLLAIEYTERVCSILSLIGTAFIVLTFLTSSAFHKPINRLVFYAAIGNVLANVGTLISRSGIRVGGGLCQFQGFLIQMFMPADALWTLAMACNVYLTFFHKYDARMLRALEWKYLIACYGIPFIPAIVELVLSTPSRGHVYGDAVLWCWVDIKWDFLRVAAFYGPAWAVILMTMIIYIICGREIFQKRKALRQFSGNVTDSAFPMVENPFESRVTREIHITSEPANGHSDSASEESVTHIKEELKDVVTYDPYSVSIGIGDRPQSGIVNKSSTISHIQRRQDIPKQITRSPKIEANRAALGYARVALLFFAAILITWVPSTVNRVNSLVRPEDVNFPLNFLSALVLPLQGFWNSIIYICTSRAATRAYLSDIASFFTRHGQSRNFARNSVTKNDLKPGLSRSPRVGRERLESDTESTKGFANV